MVRYTYHIEAESLEAAEREAMHKTYDDADRPFFAESSTSVNDAFLIRSGVLCKECENSYNLSEDKGDTCTSCLELLA
jgi:hypothetical protein